MSGHESSAVVSLCREAEAEHTSAFCVGGVSVHIASDDPRAVRLVPSLLPFEATAESADIHIRIEWSDELRPIAASRVFDSGSVWRLFGDGTGFRFDFAAPMFGDSPYKRLFMNHDFSRGTLQTSKQVFEDFSGVAPLDYPLDELLIMHRLAQERAIELHGCGIVRANGEGNLFVGHSGAGKSTTTRLWTAHEDVEVLSDDRIIVRRDVADAASAVTETPVQAAGGFGKHEVLRLRDCSPSGTNHSAQDDKTKKMRMYGTPWHGEAMYASPGSAQLARIFVLEHGRGNVLTQLSPSQAVAELFARSFVPFHRHEYVDSALEFLNELVDAVPVYRYAFEPDQRAVDKILNFRD